MRRKPHWILAIAGLAIVGGAIADRLLNPTPIEPPAATRPKESDIVGRWKWTMNDFPMQYPQGLTIIYEFREDKSFTRTTIAPPEHDDILDGTYEFNPEEMVLRKFAPTFIVTEHLQKVEKLSGSELTLINLSTQNPRHQRWGFVRVSLSD